MCSQFDWCHKSLALSGLHSCIEGSQVYICTMSNEISINTTNNLESCLSDIRDRMLNEEKFQAKIPNDLVTDNTLLKVEERAVHLAHSMKN